MDTKSYYNKIANSYQEKITHGILGKLRKKERIVVFEFLDPRPEEYILDAGCGTGVDSVEIMKAGSKVLAFDFSASMVEMAKKRGVDARVENIEDFNLNRTFDKITSQGVMEFCQNHDKIFKNFNRHLKNDGIAVVHFPYQSVSGLAYFLYHKILHSIRIKLFKPLELIKLAEKSGFKVIDFKKAHGFIAVLKLQKINEII